MTAVTAPTGPRLVSLEVRGFRAFGTEARTLQLDAPLVVVHAGNSQGKTSLDEAIEFLISGLSSAAVPFSSSSSSSSGRGLASRLVSREHDQSAWDTDQPCSLTAARKGGGDECYGDQTCMYFDRNPSNNLMSFDHVGVAFVVLLQVHAFASLYTHSLCLACTRTRMFINKTLD